MDEGRTEKKEFHLEISEQEFKGSVDRLFGVEPESPFKPIVNVEDQEALRAGIREVLGKGLNYLRDLKQQAWERKPSSMTEVLDETGKFPSIFDYDSEIAQFERALGVVNGERQSESFIPLFNRLAGARLEECVKEHEEREKSIPNVGILLWKHKDEEKVYQEIKRYENETKQIGDVLRAIKENSPKWASGGQPETSSQ